MVVLVDFEELEDLHDPHADPHAYPANGLADLKPMLHSTLPVRECDEGTAADERPNPNINGFSAALSCYP